MGASDRPLVIDFRQRADCIIRVSIQAICAQPLERENLRFSRALSYGILSHLTKQPVAWFGGTQAHGMRSFSITWGNLVGRIKERSDGSANTWNCGHTITHNSSRYCAEPRARARNRGRVADRSRVFSDRESHRFFG